MTDTGTYVEEDCSITYNGQKWQAGGAVISEELIIAFLGKDGALTNWRGEKIGTYRITSSWPIRSWYSSTMHQVYARVDGREYQGRSMGEGMSFRGKRVKNG